MRYPESPAPLSNQDAYTTWPGGIDPTARLYDSVGGVRLSKRTKFAVRSPKKAAGGLKRRKTPRRRTTRKAKISRKRSTRRH